MLDLKSIVINVIKKYYSTLETVTMFGEIAKKIAALFFSMYKRAK